jgi:ferritin
MISKKMSEALNRQLNNELYSSYLYLSMSSYANCAGMKGTANWFMVQYQEEMVHFMKFYDYINGQGIHVELAAMEAPPSEFGSFLSIFEQALKHERFITRAINECMEQAVMEKDHATQIFLQWFVTEQVEEEASAGDVIARLKMAGETGAGLLMVDGELATRVFTPPTAATA